MHQVDFYNSKILRKLFFWPWCDLEHNLFLVLLNLEKADVQNSPIHFSIHPEEKIELKKAQFSRNNLEGFY